MDFKIFIVEDDPWYGQMLSYHLTLNPDYSVNLYTTGTDCLTNLTEKPDVICLDYGLPDMKGDALVAQIRETDENIPLVIISAQEDVGVAVNLLKGGATDYIIKNEHTKDLLWKSIQNIKENITLKDEIKGLKQQLEQKYNFEKSIIGQSAAIKKTFTHIEKAVASSINVSITGETGTGKEVVAKAIHFNSKRSQRPFVAVNMAAIPKELIESELFGYEKGAFTGAARTKPGKFEEADGGTIFLDEIAELDLNLQSKLLRVLQERETVRLGGNKNIKFNARLITATHQNLLKEVQSGNFREDLYYRILGLPIELPPLRNRGQDVLLLAKFFIEEYAKENEIHVIPLSADAADKLLQYNFPGNVRELKAIIDLACVMCDQEKITPEDIRFHNTSGEEAAITASEKTLREYNVDIITFFLNKYDKNVVEVANKLDIGKSTIYNMIKSGEIMINQNSG